MNGFEEKKRQRIFVGIFWMMMALVIFLVLHRVGFSDGDDTYFYHYSTTMGFFEYLAWRYQTWVGRMAAEALVYVTFNLGLGFWRIADAIMMVLLLIGILRLGCKTAGYRDDSEFLDAYRLNDCKLCRKSDSKSGLKLSALWEAVRYPLLLATGYLLMSVMTLGYSAIWVNGSIFYTWTFTAGVWAMMPLADDVFKTGGFSKKQFLYSIPCSVIAAMSIEQMGAVLIAFEVLTILCLAMKKTENPGEKISCGIWAQTAVTMAAFVILFLAPGNDVRVASEIATWMPGYEELSFGSHLFMTAQWLLSSFANESKAFFIGIWMAAILLLEGSRHDNPKKYVSDRFYQVAAGIFSVAALLPYFGIDILSEMGIGQIDIEMCLTQVPTWQAMTAQNRMAFFWWLAAVFFTGMLLWRVTGHSIFISMVFLGGIASEAVLYFSPTIYASGARVFYLTDLLYLFLILWMTMRLDSEKKKNFFIMALLALGVINFLSQYSILLSKL